LPAVLPITRRAELKLGRPAAGGVPADLVARSQAGQAPGSPVGADGAELYLLAAERSTGQPPPPDGPVSQVDPARPERPGRVAIGLSGA
jgi:hypothetical protein